MVAPSPILHSHVSWADQLLFFFSWEDVTKCSIIGRFPLGFQCIPALILISGIWFLQESPRWLMEKDRHEEAKSVLHKLRDGENHSRIDLEFMEIRDVIAADREIAHVSTMSIFTKPSWRKRLLLGIGVQAFGPLSGINVIN